MIPIVYPYRLQSGSAKALKEILGTKIVKPDGNYIYHKNHIVINWGNSQKPKWDNGQVKVLNKWDKIEVSCNKLKTFLVFKEKGVPCPDFTSELETAKKWIKEKKTVVCRTMLRASGGKGIVIANKEEELKNCNLFTLYKKKKTEYRVAVMRGVTFDCLEKKRRKDWDEAKNGPINTQVRNHDFGWVFCREDIKPPKQIFKLAIDAVNALGLDFGSVDIIYNQLEDKAYVLEVNAAPGLEETSLERYSAALEAVILNKEIKSIEVA